MIIQFPINRSASLSWAVLLFVGCSPSVQSDGCPASDEVVVATRSVMPIGKQQRNFAALESQPDSGVTIRVTALREGVAPTRLVSSGPELRFNSLLNEWFTFDSPAAGETSLHAELVCGGRVVGERVVSHYSYPTVSTRRFPRLCSNQFDLLDSDDSPTLFQCDGAVVDANGQPVSNWGVGDVQVIHRDGDFVRWVAASGTLVYERGVFRSAPLTFNPTPAIPAGATLSGTFTWQSASDFAVSATQLALLADGGLSISPFDAGVFSTVICRQPYDAIDCYSDYHVCAAASNGTTRGIAYCETSAIDTMTANYFPRAPLYICPLFTSGPPALGTCHETAGIIIRQERQQDNLLLVQRGRDLYWVDLLTQSETFVRTLRPDEQSNQGSGREQQGGFPEQNERLYNHGYTGYFGRAPNLTIVVPVLPDRNPEEAWLPVSLETEYTTLQPNEWYRPFASSDFVWGFDQRDPDAGTYWAPLP